MSTQVEVFDQGDIILVRVPISFKRRCGRKEIVMPAGYREPRQKAEDPRVIALARGFLWQRLLDSGKYATMQELADEIEVSQTLVATHLRLVLMQPGEVEIILKG